MTLGRGGIYGDPRSEWEKEQERLMQGLLTPETQQAVDAYAAMPQGLLAEPEKPKGFWQGGEKFGVRDGIGGLLAAIADIADAQRGRQGGTIDELLGMRLNAQEMARKKAEEQAQMAQAMAVADRLGTPRDHVLAKQYGVPIPEAPEQHEFQRLSALMNDPSQPPEVRKAAKMKLEGDPVLTGVNLPSGGQFYGRLSDLQSYAGQGTSGSIEDEWNNAKPLGGGTGNGVGGFRTR